MITITITDPHREGFQELENIIEMLQKFADIDRAGKARITTNGWDGPINIPPHSHEVTVTAAENAPHTQGVEYNEDYTNGEIPQIPPAPSNAPSTADVSALPIVPVAPQGFTVPQVPAAPVASNVELDINGLPWDGRIHSREKSKLKDQTWRYKRQDPKKGLSEKEVKRIEGELRASLGQPPAFTGYPQACAASVPPVAPAPPAAPTAVPQTQWDQLMDLVQSALAGGKISREQIQTTVAAVPEAVNLMVVRDKPELVPQVLSAINALVLSV